MYSRSFWILEKYLQFPSTVVTMGCSPAAFLSYNPKMPIHIHDAVIPGVLGLTRSLTEGHGVSCPTSN